MSTSRGFMRGATRKVAKHYSERGQQPVTKYLQEFEMDEEVHVDLVSSERSGMPMPKFQGKTGRVVGRQGGAFVVQVTDGKAVKKILVKPVHLKKKQVKTA